MINPNETLGPGRPPAVVETYATHDRAYSRVSWGAIVAGSIVGLATQLILSLIGVGIGITAAGGDDLPSQTAVGAGVVIYWILSSVVALFVGGFVAGRLAGIFNGYLHGLATWASVTLASLLLLGSAAGGLLSGASGLAQIGAQSPDLRARVEAEVRSVMRNLPGPTIAPGAGASQPGISTETGVTTGTGGEQISSEQRDRMARNGAMVAFGAAGALIIGAGAAGIGGVLGKRRFLQVVPDRKDLLPTSRY